MDASQEPIPEATPVIDPRIAELETEVARLRDTILRAQADQQNQARRHQRDLVDLRKFAASPVIEDILPALDSLRIGLESASTQASAAAVATGFAMAVQQLRSALSSHGLIEVEAAGLVFDPARHEALSQETSDVIAEGNVVRVLRSGWMLSDRLLRPAGVVVSKGPAV
jgi:molecular chaperone GrpE